MSWLTAINWYHRISDVIGEVSHKSNVVLTGFECIFVTERYQLFSGTTGER